MYNKSAAVSRVFTFLGWFGLVPFIVPVCWVLLFDGRADLLRQSHSTFSISLMYHSFIVYSGVILSFLAGTQWMQLLSFNVQPISVEKSNITNPAYGPIITLLTIMTNIVALVAWFAVLMGNLFQTVALCALTAGYAATWWVEYFNIKLIPFSQVQPVETQTNSSNLSGWKFLKGGYFAMRSYLTLIVIGCHLILLAVLFY